MAASRKLYEAIAVRIDCLDLDSADKIEVAAAVANALAEDNPRFAPERFMEACGIEDHQYLVMGGFGPRTVVTDASA